MDPLTCARCGAEVRHGSRDGGLTVAWLHRDPDVDHVAVLGYVASDAMRRHWERELDLPRERVVIRRKKYGPTKDMPAYHAEWCEIETYTTRAHDFARMSPEARGEQAAEVEEGEEESPLEPIEVYSTPAPLKGVMTVETPDGPRPVATPQGVRNIANAAERAGWTVVELAYSRGPWMGAKGGSLGVADVHRLTVRGPDVDGAPRIGVAWWRNAKAQSVWRVENKTVTQIGAKALISWMKECPRAEE